MMSCGRTWEVQDMQDNSSEVEVSVLSKDAKAEAIISPKREEMAIIMDEVLCTSANDMSKARPESALGNWVSDLCLWTARKHYRGMIDGAIFNHGGLRSSISAGDVSRGDIFSLMPFDNELVLVRINRAGMDRMASYLAERGGEPISEMSLSIRDGIPLNFAVQQSALEDRDYWLLSSDYLANGGDKMDFLLPPYQQEKVLLNIKVRDAIIDYCVKIEEEGKMIEANEDGRIRYE